MVDQTTLSTNDESDESDDDVSNDSIEVGTAEVFCTSRESFCAS